MTGKSGWYMDLLSPTGTGGALVAQGERIVTSNQFQGNLLLGTTRIPQAADICNPSGSGWIMAINPFTGTNPSDNFFDVNGDGLVNASDTVTVNGTSYPAAGIGFSSLPNNPIFVGGSMLVSFDNGSNSSITTSGSTGSIQRVSWRELISQ
jgi:type IV pilus assembly protein PilY1